MIWQYLTRTKRALFLEGLANKNGARVKYGWDGASIDFDLEGSPAAVRFLPASRRFLIFSQPPRLSVLAACSTSGEFFAHKKGNPGFPDPRVKKIPVVETGNSLFDNEFEVRSYYSGFIRSNFKDGEKRQAMRRIFTLGATGLTFNGEHVAAFWEPFNPAHGVDEDFLRETHKRLVDLTRNLQPAESARSKDTSGLYTLILAFLAIFIATVVFSFFLIANV